MTTNPTPESMPPAARRHRPRRSAAPTRAPGRPARPWLRPRLPVPHPIHPEALTVSVTQDQAAAWTGRSRQTVARWVAAGACPDLAAARLLALYAHGCPPIPPEACQAREAREWGRFRFAPDRSRPGSPWCLVTPCSGDALAWTQADDAGASRRRLARLDADLERWRARALAAEAEAGRWRDLVASAT